MNKAALPVITVLTALGHVAYGRGKYNSRIGHLGPKMAAIILPSPPLLLPLGEGLRLIFGCKVDDTEKYVCDVAPTGTPPPPHGCVESLNLSLIKK